MDHFKTIEPKIVDLRQRKVCILAINYWPVRPGQGTRHPKNISDMLATRFPLTVITRPVNRRFERTFRTERDGNTRVIRIPFLQFKKAGYFWRWLSNLSFAMNCVIASAYLGRKGIIFTVGPDPTYFIISAPIIRLLTFSKHIALLTDLLPDVFFAIQPVRQSSLRGLITAVCVRSYMDPDHLVVITDALKNRLVEYGVSPEKISVVQLAVDVQKFSPIESNIGDFGLGELQGKFLVVYSGSLGSMYDFKTIVKAAKIIEGLEPNVSFIIRGQGEEEELIRQEIRDSKIGNVTLLPPLERSEDVVSFFNVASIFLVSIKDLEGIGLTQPSKIIEYWACGKPVICTGLPGLSDTLSRSAASILVPPGNPGAIADAILDLYHNPSRLAQMGLNGRRFAVDNYASDLVREKILDVIYQVGAK